MAKNTKPSVKPLGDRVLLQRIEEAEEMADRIGIINKGKLILTENKNTLMHKMGKRQMIFVLRDPLEQIPIELSNDHITLEEEELYLGEGWLFCYFAFGIFL